MKVAINGMGRIGRLLFRRLLNLPGIDLVAVNDIMEPANLLYLLRYDSVFGPMNEYIYLSDNGLEMADRTIAVYNSADINDLPWDMLQVDLVIEASGSFTDRESCGDHIRSGAGRVLLTTTGKPDIPLYIFGFGNKYPKSDDIIFAAGGCMTNCTTQVLNILKPLGIRSAHINVIHSYTSRQSLVDHPHAEFRRGRASATSIIPVDIDLARSLESLLNLAGRIETSSTRVPVANGAMVDFIVQVEETHTVEAINQRCQTAAAGSHKDIIKYTGDPIVSVDIKGNPASVIIDGSLTSVIDNQVRIVGWFDNEYGYTSRILDWIKWFVANKNQYS